MQEAGGGLFSTNCLTLFKLSHVVLYMINGTQWISNYDFACNHIVLAFLHIYLSIIQIV